MVFDEFWGDLRLLKNHWKSLKIIENHWKSTKITENQWFSVQNRSETNPMTFNHPKLHLECLRASLGVHGDRSDAILWLFGFWYKKLASNGWWGRTPSMEGRTCNLFRKWLKMMVFRSKIAQKLYQWLPMTIKFT